MLAMEALVRWAKSLFPKGALRMEQCTLVNATRGTIVGDRIELAQTSSQRRKGLLGRAGLAHGEGLWIVPCESVHTFRMQFAIDLVYLDRNRRVLKTRSGLRPGRVSACLRAHSVLELPSGTVRTQFIEPGHQLERGA